MRLDHRKLEWSVRNTEDEQLEKYKPHQVFNIVNKIATVYILYITAICSPELYESFNKKVSTK